ncbi:L-glutamine synthetase [Methanosarcina thermophila]|nr:type I glutamate--ammonia ligase [Methanosarcina thermophila]ALK04641.1 MAG: glutamine synthetase [Methanosarcina sp. 795]NLU57944.1 type I glutamate--ammonia ligase [Methanosarcina thermophila]SFT33845.1 L-glutamine synthetase [Methanosarcina thermophila]HOA67768.1 type I glutamate--ammonia ligase [Methanosarcina thermophila]HOQ64527.1 type I glutamate--ammonia ligase [Methanosarcina thermophila]
MVQIRKCTTKEDVMETVKERDVKFIRTQFTDILGTIKSWAIPVEQLEEAFENGVMFDGSSIQGFTRIEESDMKLVLDPSTFRILPWRPATGAVARILGDVYLPDGRPFEGDPRYVLKSAIAEAEKMGYSMNVGPELEFFLFKLDANGNPTTELTDQGGYFDFAPLDRAQDVRRDIDYALEHMGFQIEASHHEVAPSQHEIDFRFGDVLSTADNVITFKYVVKSIAYHKGYYATFMPKPLFGVNGSGMHTNQSLFMDGKNAFYDPDTPTQLSHGAMYYIGGLLAHIREFTAIINPVVNSYKRIVPGYEAPVYITWSAKNRSSLIRIPATRGNGTRVELRCPDPACNPYLAFALMLRAGLDGIKNKIDPGEPTNANIFHLTEKEREKRGIRSLPANLKEAIDEMRGSEFVKEVLGEHVFSHYLCAKEMEWNEYKAIVHPWELDKYLHML